MGCDGVTESLSSEREMMCEVAYAAAEFESKGGCGNPE